METKCPTQPVGWGQSPSGGCGQLGRHVLWSLYGSTTITIRTPPCPPPTIGSSRRYFNSILYFCYFNILLFPLLIVVVVMYSLSLGDID